MTTVYAAMRNALLVARGDGWEAPERLFVGTFKDGLLRSTDGGESTLVSVAEGYDTTCLGVSEVSSVEHVLSGAIPERIGEHVAGTIVVVRGTTRPTRSLRSAILRRLAV